MEQVVRGLASPVFSFLSGMLGDQREAEEGMQETFVRAARALERYEEGTDPEGWVFAIARRVANDIRPTPASPPGETPPAEGDAAEWASRSLRALPSELREVLVFKELMHWAPERVATALGTDTSEVTRRLLSARTQLAENMRAAP